MLLPIGPTAALRSRLTEDIIVNEVDVMLMSVKLQARWMVGYKLGVSKVQWVVGLSLTNLHGSVNQTRVSVDRSWSLIHISHNNG